MKTKHKIFLGTIASLLLLVIVLTVQVQANKKIEAFEKEKESLKAMIDTQSEKIETLSGELSIAKQMISIQEPMIEEYKKYAQFVDFDALESTQLEKAKEISERTPLEYESAVVMVKYADMYDIPYSLILSIIDIESGFDKNKVGSSQDRGYMQIIPSTEKWLANSFGSELGIAYNPDRIFEPEYNLALGIKYLDKLMDDYGANYDRVLSEYNRGASNLKKYYEANKTYATTYSTKVLDKQDQYVAFNGN